MTTHVKDLISRFNDFIDEDLTRENIPKIYNLIKKTHKIQNNDLSYRYTRLIDTMKRCGLYEYYLYYDFNMNNEMSLYVKQNRFYWPLKYYITETIYDIDGYKTIKKKYSNKKSYILYPCYICNFAHTNPTVLNSLYPYPTQNAKMNEKYYALNKISDYIPPPNKIINNYSYVNRTYCFSEKYMYIIECHYPSKFNGFIFGYKKNDFENNSYICDMCIAHMLKNNALYFITGPL